MCTQPFLNALLMAQFTDSLIHDVSSWLHQAEGWSSGSKMVVVNKSSNVRECSCKQGSEKGFHEHRHCQQAMTVLYIHGSLKSSKLLLFRS